MIVLLIRAELIITSPTSFTILYIKNQTKITNLPTEIDYLKH
jgi:hypothetical protein